MYEEENEDILILRSCAEPAHKLLELTQIMTEKIQENKAYLSTEEGEKCGLELCSLGAKTSVTVRKLKPYLPSYRGNSGRMEKTMNAIYREAGYGFEWIENNWLRGVLPMPSNKRSKKGYWETEDLNYVIQCLYWQFMETEDPNAIQRLPINPATVVFKYLLDEGVRQIPDYDNMDVSATLNAIKWGFIRDDSMECISLYSCSASSNTTALVIYVIPQDDFPEWLETREKQPEKRIFAMP